MDNMFIINTQNSMEKTYNQIKETLKYIEFIETTRPLNEKEKALKYYCTEMRSLTQDTMQMLDEGTL